MISEVARDGDEWPALLDRLDATLDAAWDAVGRADLDAVGASIDALAASPLELAPLPGALGPRAAGIVARMTDLGALLGATRDEVRRDLSVAERLAPGAACAPRYIDRRC